jgi:hypothetical protein
VRSIAEVLASIPIKADRFPHLVELSTDAMLLRRVEIAEGVHVDTLKALPTLRTPPLPPPAAVPPTESTAWSDAPPEESDPGESDR